MSFGLRVMTFDPYVTVADCDKAGVVKLELDDLLRQADFVSIHTPLTPETKGLMRYGPIPVDEAHLGDHQYVKRSKS